MLKIIILIFFFIFNFSEISYGSIKDKIIKNLNKIENFNFNFKQTISEKTEKGNCTIQYPKKIYCIYKKNKKIMVSNGKSLVIKSDKINNYLRYSLKKTPLNLILDKKFIISKIYELKEDLDYPFYYVFDINVENISTKIFFDKKNLDLIGWETKDIYQNKVQTFISDIKKNIPVDKKIFIIQNYIN